MDVVLTFYAKLVLTLGSGHISSEEFITIVLNVGTHGLCLGQHEGRVDHQQDEEVAIPHRTEHKGGLDNVQRAITESEEKQHANEG